MSEHVRLERAEYIRGEGAVLIASIANRFLEQLENMQPEKLQALEGGYMGGSQPDTVAAGLRQFAQKVTEQIVLWPEDPDTHNQFGIRKEDIEPPRNRFIFRHGLGDFKFTFYFASAVAANIMNQAIDERYLTVAERNEMRFSDWADIMESQWFGSLIHELAFTANGIYVTFGESPNDYSLHAFSRHLSSRINTTDPAFVLQPDPGNPKKPIALLHPAVRARLTERMRHAGSAGCPAARHIGKIATEQTQTNPHVQHLVTAGKAQLNQAKQQEVALVQMHTTVITSFLNVYAALLRRYDATYGTPYADPKDPYRCLHRRAALHQVALER